MPLKLHWSESEFCRKTAAVNQAPHNNFQDANSNELRIKSPYQLEISRGDLESRMKFLLSVWPRYFLQSRSLRPKAAVERG